MIGLTVSLNKHDCFHNQGSHRNPKSQFHDFSMIYNVMSTASFLATGGFVIIFFYLTKFHNFSMIILFFFQIP